MPQTRQSNIELLRLLCMFFIVVNHIIRHALPMSVAYRNDIGFASYVPMILDAFMVCGVPVFVLISGYFGIKFKTKGLLNFYVQCAFYSCVIYLIYLFIEGLPLNRWCIYNTLFPITNNADLWFVECYFMLYLLSPLLNKCIENLSKRDFSFALLVLFLINIYYGWFLRKTTTNVDGYNISNFIFLYFLGRYVSRYINPKQLNYKRIYCLLIFIFGSLLLGTLPILNAHFAILPDWHPLFEIGYYNHPLLIADSVALLFFFLSLNFHSRTINWLANSTFAVYLIHENSYIRDYWYNFIAKAIDTTPPLTLRITIVFSSALSVLIICILIDKLRQLITNPIVNFADTFIKSHIFT